MNSAIVQTFQETSTEVSFWIDEEGQDLMQAKGIFEALDLSVTNISTTLERHVDIDYRRQVAIGRGMPAWYVTYEGLIQLAFATKAPRAKVLQKWVSQVIKTIIKTGSYTATAADQQHFQPFGITLQLKIDECDRAIETAAVGTGKVRAILADRKALEQAYMAQPRANEDLLAEFIGAFVRTYGAGKPVTPKTMSREMGFICGASPASLGKFLAKNQGQVKAGYCIKKLRRTEGGQPWTVDAPIQLNDRIEV